MSSQQTQSIIMTRNQARFSDFMADYEGDGPEVTATVGEAGVIAIIGCQPLYIFEGPENWRSVPVESVVEMVPFDFLARLSPQEAQLVIDAEIRRLEGLEASST